MRNLSLSFFRCAWALGILLLSLHASADPVRVAVAGDPSLANLVDLATAELSQQAELSVLDRAALDKLGQEQQLQSVLAAKDFSPVRLLPADGLVLLRAVKDKGKTNIFARLVAVQPGVVLREFVLPEGDDAAAQVQALTAELKPLWPKLAAIQKGKIEALSLLGLRFDVDSPETREMERRINILLASRLGAEPDILVLERWRLNDAAFEKSLTPAVPAPFWTGSSLLDGGLRWQNQQVEVTLRLRPPQGQEITINDQDTPDHLPELVERLAAKIRANPLAAGTWKPGDEAAHYAKLGKWCLDNLLFAEGAEALESALALGDDTRTTHFLQIKANARQAYPDPLRSVVPESDSYEQRNQMTPDSMPQRVAAATRAALLMPEYLEKNKAYTTPRWTEELAPSLGVRVQYVCLRTLRAAYVTGWSAAHADETTALRHAIQKMNRDIEAQALPQLADVTRSAFLNNRAFYAGLWHDTPEETIAYYRALLGDKTDGASRREMIFQSSYMREPYCDGEGEAFSTSPRALGPPWIVSWTGSPPDELKAVWQNFIKEQAASPDVLTQCDAFKFELCSCRTREGRRAVAARFIPFLQRNADYLTGPQADDFAAGIGGLIFSAMGDKRGPGFRGEIVALELALFQKHQRLSTTWIYTLESLIRTETPTETLKSLLDGLEDYSGWYTKTPQDFHHSEAIKNMRMSIYRMRPELVPAATPQDAPLAVTRFWNNEAHLKPDSSNANTPKYFHIDARTIITEGDNIWFISRDQPHQLYCVNSSTFQVVSCVALPKELDPSRSPWPSPESFLEVTPEFLVVGIHGQVLLGSRTGNQWRALDLPLSNYKPRWVGGQLYLIYDVIGLRESEKDPTGLRSPSSGLVHVSLPDGATESLISSRRVPPQSALDGRDLGVAMDLWLSQGGLTLALASVAAPGPLQVYASPVGKNEWALFTSERDPSHVKVSSGSGLIGKGFNFYGFSEMTRIDASGTQVLLANPDRVPPTASNHPQWKLPAELRTMVSPLLRGHDLCVYYVDGERAKKGVTDGTQASLYYFTEGQEEGLKIPLAFDLDRMQDVNLAKYQRLGLAYEGLQATDFGLVIGQSLVGLWVIPWSDIDAYRAKAKPAGASK